MSEIQSMIDSYFAQHPINIEQIKQEYEENCITKILDDKTGKPFKLGVYDSKMYMKEKEILM